MASQAEGFVLTWSAKPFIHSHTPSRRARAAVDSGDSWFPMSLTPWRVAAFSPAHFGYSGCQGGTDINDREADVTQAHRRAKGFEKFVLRNRPVAGMQDMWQVGRRSTDDTKESRSKCVRSYAQTPRIHWRCLGSRAIWKAPSLSLQPLRYLAP